MTIAKQIKFKAGIDYKVLANTLSKNQQIVEYFSFYCPYCYKFEPTASLLKRKYKDIFTQKSVSFLGGKMGIIVSSAYYASKILGRADIVKQILFNKIQVTRINIQSIADIEQLLCKTKIDLSNFKASYASFMVQNRAMQIDRELVASNINSVPAVVINNRYLLENKQAGNTARYLQLVDYLLAKDNLAKK